MKTKNRIAEQMTKIRRIKLSRTVVFGVMILGLMISVPKGFSVFCCDGVVTFYIPNCCTASEKAQVAVNYQNCLDTANSDHQAEYAFADQYMEQQGAALDEDLQYNLDLIQAWQDAAYDTCDSGYNWLDEPAKSGAIAACKAGARLLSGEMQGDAYGAYGIELGFLIVAVANHKAGADLALWDDLGNCDTTYRPKCDNDSI